MQIRQNDKKFQRSKQKCCFTDKFTNNNQYHIQGEAISTFQLGNNLRRKNRTTIYRISHNESVLDGQTDVQNCITEYFTNLYSAVETRENDILNPPNHHPRRASRQ
jgi:hypothetical protein